MSLIDSEQIKLINSLEAINDILVSETKKSKEKRVLIHIEQLNTHVENLFSLNQNNFENLMLNPDSQGDSSFFFWDFESYSKPFVLIMKIYINIYQAAIEVNSQKIILDIGIGLNSILKIITPSIKMTKDHIDYNKLLEIYFSEQRKLFMYSINEGNMHSHIFAYHWYTSRVFKNYNKEELFNLEFLPYLNKKLFEFLIYSIDNSDSKWFRELVSWMHHGIGFLDNLYSDIYDFVGYEEYEEFTPETINELDETFSEIKTKEELDIWLDKFDYVKVNVLKRYAKDDKANQIIDKAQQQYLFFNIKQLITGLSAYLIYRKKYDSIIELWDFKQPIGTISHWIGHSVLPDTVKELIELSNISYRSSYCFHDEHIDCKYYLDKYVLYRLIYLMSREDYQPQNTYITSKDEIYIAQIKHYIEHLYSISDNIIEDENTLKVLKLETTPNIREVLNSIKEECNTKLEEITINTKLKIPKVEKFKEGYINSYKKARGIKSLFKLFNSYDEDLSLVKEEYKFGINTLAPKDVFTSSLVMGVDMFGSDYARNMIDGENKNILTKILNNLTVFNGTINEIFDEITPENILILSANNINLIHNKNFIGGWRCKNKVKHSSFQGTYRVGKVEIPIFRFFIDIKDKYIILDKTKLPEIYQYSPSTTNSLTEEFYISIQDVKDNDTLIQTIIGKENLSGDEAEKKKVDLLKKVHIEIYESYQMVFDGFKGYILEEKDLT